MMRGMLSLNYFSDIFIKFILTQSHSNIQSIRVSLEVLEDGTPKPPSESWNDNLPKLYIHHGAFMKVLGGTLDIDLNAESGELKPKLFDREGHEMDPNA